MSRPYYKQVESITKPYRKKFFKLYRQFVTSARAYHVQVFHPIMEIPSSMQFPKFQLSWKPAEVCHLLKLRLQPDHLNHIIMLHYLAGVSDAISCILISRKKFQNTPTFVFICPNSLCQTLKEHLYMLSKQSIINSIHSLCLKHLSYLII